MSTYFPKWKLACIVVAAIAYTYLTELVLTTAESVSLFPLLGHLLGVILLFALFAAGLTAVWRRGPFPGRQGVAE